MMVADTHGFRAGHYQRVRHAGMKMLKEGCPALRADPEESPLQLSS
jgi:hypothetical protein